MSSNDYPPRWFLKLFWRRAIPFWLFRDAGRGSEEQRIANYRYNRSQRGVLPFFIFKWIGIAVSLMMLLKIFSGLMLKTIEGTFAHICVTTLCMSAGIAFSFSCVVITILSGCYLFLCRIKK
jgi:hypothetical protein